MPNLSEILTGWPRPIAFPPQPAGSLCGYWCMPGRRYPATVLARLIWASKLAQGAEEAAIVRKELALSGIPRPLYPGELGEDAVEVFRFGDFVGWIIEG